MSFPPWSANAPCVAPTHPDWFGEVRRKYTLRITDWVRQAWAVTLAPHRFLTEWVDGRRETLNPLRFFAVGTAALFLIDRLGRKLLHVAPAPSQGASGFLNSSTGSMVLVLVGATCLHVVLRLRSRAPLRSSVAAVMFTSAGPGVLLSFLGWLLSGALHLTNGRVGGALLNGAFTPWPVVVLSALSFGWTVIGLTGVHRVRWWWSVLALLIAPVLAALITVVILAAGRWLLPSVTLPQIGLFRTN